MTFSRSCLLASSLFFGAFAEDQHGTGATVHGAASWTADGERLPGLELLQKKSAKIQSGSGNRAAAMVQQQPFQLEVDPKDPCHLPKGAIWCTATSGNKSWVMALYDSYEDNFVSSKICQSGFWEFPDLSSLGIPTKKHKPLVLLDIGANLGWYSFMFAAHGHKVLAVEPMTHNRHLMRATLCKNPDLAPRIHIFATALTNSASAGQSCGIYSCSHNTGDGVLACNDQDRYTMKDCYYVQREEVPLLTLDTLLAEHPHVFGKHVDMVKVDVEGQECNVLDGALQFFTKYRPGHVMIENRITDEDYHGKTFECISETIFSYGQYSMRPGNFAKGGWSMQQVRAKLNGTVDLFYSL